MLRLLLMLVRGSVCNEYQTGMAPHTVDDGADWDGLGILET